jgi:hypothetical protein
MQLYSLKEEILLIIWCTVPVIVTFIESKLMTPLYSARYFSWVSPALYLLVARGLANLSKKWLVYPLILLIVLLSAYGLQVQYSTNTWPDWRSATEFVELSSNMNDILIFYSGIGLPGFEYYYEGNLPRYRVGSKDNLIDISDPLDRTIADSDRAWFILSYKCKSDSTKKHLIDRYGSESIILEKEFHGISIILIDLPN